MSRGLKGCAPSFFSLGCAVLGLVACAAGPRGAHEGAPGGPVADVIAVQATGDAGAYLFSVALSSPDSGCERYADWWEVVSPDGRLLFRRILGHSHAHEQPFTRSGGPVAVDADQEVLVRAHLHPSGYGGAVLRGSVAAGFSVDPSVGPRFAAGLAEKKPLPDSCEF